jgi:hypothetical protein
MVLPTAAEIQAYVAEQVAIADKATVAISVVHTVYGQIWSDRFTELWSVSERELDDVERIDAQVKAEFAAERDAKAAVTAAFDHVKHRGTLRGIVHRGRLASTIVKYENGKPVYASDPSLGNRSERRRLANAVMNRDQREPIAASGT